MSSLKSRVIKKTKKFRGQWISVEDWTYRRSDNFEITHETLVDDDTAIVLPLDEKTGQVTMLSEFRDPFNGWSWRLPWGYVDNGEKPETAARRELEEEAGLRAKRLKRVFLRRPEGKNMNRVHAFLATGLSQTKAHPEPSEKIRIRKMPLPQAAAMALNGKINEPVVSMLVLRVAMKRKISELKMRETKIFHAVNR